MHKDEYNGTLALIRNEVDHLRDTKGKTYAGTEDQFANFKKIAEETGLNKYQIWNVYFSKHISAIHSFIRCEYSDTEPIEGRIADAMNYLGLLHGMIKEDEVK